MAFTARAENQATILEPLSEVKKYDVNKYKKS